MIRSGIFTLLILLTFACKQKETKVATAPVDTVAVKKTEPKEAPKPTYTYQFMPKKDWQALKDSFEGHSHLNILNAINRVDTTHLKRLDSILVPNDYSGEVKDYLPFPDHLAVLDPVNKIILFSNPTQAFAAYEKGHIVHAGPTNTGRKNNPTPSGLYFTNWKSKKSVSTVSDEWILKWNFNIDNRHGIGFHEYGLPGYPASHSCMRLLGADAQYLYYWAEQWILKNSRELAASGTPVLVLGKYPFGEDKPWLQLASDPKALNLSEDSLTAAIQPHLQTILDRQKQRRQLTAPKTINDSLSASSR
ncbi:hypothetical protein GCM10027051_28310 [Niabella terrae]